MTVAHRLCRRDDPTGGSCHGINTVDADAGPGERSRHAFANTQLHVLANDSGSFGVDFGDDLVAGPDQIGGTPEQPTRSATDVERGAAALVDEKAQVVAIGLCPPLMDIEQAYRAIGGNEVTGGVGKSLVHCVHSTDMSRADMPRADMPERRYVPRRYARAS